MHRLNSLKKFNLKKGEANFLIGISGNGLSTMIQTEIYTKAPKDIYYLNYISFPDPTERNIAIEFISKIIFSLTGEKYTEKDFPNVFSLFDIFTKTIEIINNSKPKQKHVVIIFDEFQKLQNYTNSFFFLLDKIATLTRIIDELELTMIFISDIYLNPRGEMPAEGMAKLLIHHPNFFVIPTPSFDQIIGSNFRERFLQLDASHQKKVYELSGGIPTLFVSVVDLISHNEQSTNLLENYEIEWKVNEIWESLGSENQDILKSYLIGRPQPATSELQKQFLEKTGVLDIENHTIHSKLLEQYTSKQINLEALRTSDFLVLNENQINLADLAPQLEEILKLLYENQGKLVRRDDIAKRLWGDQYLSKYSDYAIDKTISKIRTILDSDSSTKGILKTKKGKGYILSTK